LGGPVFLLFLALFALAATAEFFQLLGLSSRWGLTAAIIIAVPYFLNLYLAILPWDAYLLGYLILSVSGLFVFLNSRISFLQGVGVVFGGMFVPILASTLYLVRGLENGMILTLAVFVLTWGTDSGAFFIGKQFGKRKLAPSISPNKSWAGAIGGLASGLIIAVGFGILTDANIALFALWGGLTSAAGQIGDLCESAFKRHAGVKDSGAMLPGHGGFLDRIDSLLFTAAISYIFFGMVL